MRFSSIAVDCSAIAMLLHPLLLLAHAVPVPFSSYWLQCRPNLDYAIPDESFCDKYYLCKDGIATEKICPDGLGFVPFGDCKPLHQVECGPRNLLQPPTGSGKCPRSNGVFSAPEGCGKFYKCFEGIAQNAACPNGQMFDELKVQCRYPTTDEELSCAGIWYPPEQATQPPPSLPPQPDFPLARPDPGVLESVASGFPDLNSLRCPENDRFPFGGHSRQPIPGYRCKYFLLCQLDGSKKIASCPDGLGFNPGTMVCDQLVNLPGCI